VSGSSDEIELGAGGIAGIGVGAAFVILFAVIILLALIWCVHRRRKQR